MYNFIQNFQNNSVISVLTCIKHYLQTQFEFNSENVGISYKRGNLVIFNFTVRVCVRLFCRHQCRQRSGFLDLESQVNLRLYILMCSIQFCSHLKSAKNKGHKHNILNLLPAIYNALPFKCCFVSVVPPN